MTATVVDTFPTSYLDKSESALVVFAAAYGGAQDAAHIRDAGLHAVCVDHDYDKLEQMRDQYPPDWVFIDLDAFKFLDQALARNFTFDAVTLDPFTGDTMDRTIEHLPDWCKLARRVVICGVDGRELAVPDGWRIKTKTWRSNNRGGVYWAVLVPA